MNLHFDNGVNEMKCGINTQINRYRPSEIRAVILSSGLRNLRAQKSPIGQFENFSVSLATS